MDERERKARVDSLEAKRARAVARHKAERKRISTMTDREARAYARSIERDANTVAELTEVMAEVHAWETRHFDEQIGQLRGELAEPALGTEDLPEIMRRLGIR